MFSCICVDDNDDGYDMKSFNGVSDMHTSYTSERIPGTNSHNQSRKHVDRIVIYTGASVSSEIVDDSHGHGYNHDDDRFSEVYSALESEPELSGDDTAGEGSTWIWPKDYIIPGALNKDPEKLDLLNITQQTIDRADKNYVALAYSCDFKLDSSAICRYLEANLWQSNFPNGQTIAERVMESIEWRCSFPLPVRNISVLETELATGKNFVQGKSKDGRPIVYLILGRENTWNPAGNILALVYTLERAIRSMSAGVQETICIIDCDGVGMMNAPTLTFLSQVIEILGKHYPRRNGQIFICNVSSVFYFLWNAVSVTLSEVTKKKVHILTNDKAAMREEIGQIIDLSTLSSDYGGLAKIQFNVKSYLAADGFLNKLQR